jgi:peptidoglycan/xylan/chitin deacetylase (PgdA/CDA1 family)
MDKAGAFPWPEGSRGAVAFTFDVDAESAILALDPSFETRPSLMSHQRYGPTSGVPRLLHLLEERGLRATFFVPGFTAERHRDAVRAIADAGHEIAHHGYLHESLVGKSRLEELAFIERGLEALERAAGIRPLGYRAPWWELGEHTIELLAGAGFAYDSSMFERDVPYAVGPPAAPLIEIPVSWALDDWERYAFWPNVMGSGIIARPSEVLEAWWEEIDALLEAGGCAVVTMHPFLSGRPARARALAELIDRVRSRDDVWVTTCGEIAAHAARALELDRPGRPVR